MSTSRTDIDRLHARIASMIERGTIDEIDDARLMQSVGLSLKSGYRPRQVEHWHPYGMTFHPHAGAEVIALMLGGNPDHIIAIPGADRRYRMKGLAGGELAIHDDQGQFVHFKRGGLAIESSKPVSVKSGAGITLEGPLTFKGDITHEGNMTTTGRHTDADGPHTA